MSEVMVHDPASGASQRAPLLSAEEFQRLYEGSPDRTELVNGRVLRMPPANSSHGQIDHELQLAVGNFVRGRRLGRVYANTGFILRREPDCVRGPDVAFVSAERLHQHSRPRDGFWELAPDLAVEIVSPGESADEINAKVRDYLETGVQTVWLFYPRQRTVHVFHQDGRAEVILETGTLQGDRVLPGFELALGEFWAEALA